MTSILHKAGQELKDFWNWLNRNDEDEEHDVIVMKIISESMPQQRIIAESEPMSDIADIASAENQINFNISTEPEGEGTLIVTELKEATRPEQKEVFFKLFGGDDDSEEHKDETSEEKKEESEKSEKSEDESEKTEEIIKQVKKKKKSEHKEEKDDEAKDADSEEDDDDVKIIEDEDNEEDKDEEKEVKEESEKSSSDEEHTPSKPSKHKKVKSESKIIEEPSSEPSESESESHKEMEAVGEDYQTRKQMETPGGLDALMAPQQMQPAVNQPNPYQYQPQLPQLPTLPEQQPFGGQQFSNDALSPGQPADMSNAFLGND